MKLKFPLNSSTRGTTVPLWKSSITFCFVVAVCLAFLIFFFFFSVHCKAVLSWLHKSQRNQQKAFRFNLKDFSFRVSLFKSSDLIFSSLKTLHNLKGKQLPGHRTTSINLQNPVSRAVSSVVNLKLCTGE